VEAESSDDVSAAIGEPNLDNSSFWMKVLFPSPWNQTLV